MYESDKISLLQAYMSRDLEHYKFLQADFRVYTALNSAIVGTTLLALNNRNASLNQELFIRFVFTFGGFLAIGLSIIAIWRLGRAWRSCLENAATRAKLEDVIGLTNKDLLHAQNFWKDEPIIFERHIRHQKESCSSADFVERRAKEGTGKIIRVVFLAFILIGVLFILLGLFAPPSWLFQECHIALVQQPL
jgi:hypothetical protein